MSKNVDKYIDTVGTIYLNLPNLPVGVRKVIVEILPWLVFVFGLISTAFSIISLGALPFSGYLEIFTGVKLTSLEIISTFLTLIASILLFASFVGVQKRRERGWKILYLSEFVSLVVNILKTTLVGVIFSLIAFYFLYQIRKYYK